MNSRLAIILISCLWLIAGSLYYPKWKLQWSEAAISWDVSGYYHYLPAIFIYKDVRKQAYMEDINKQYLPSPAYDQSFIHPESGNRVNKYAIGQAVLFSPFFFIAHVYASVTDAFPADGYSRPYQVAIWIGGLIAAIIGLILLRSVLRNWFDDSITGWILLTLGLCTNFFEYAAISNGMNHNWLFALVSLLLFATHSFYQKPNFWRAGLVGLSMGLIVLTRPTEGIFILIPLLWNFSSIKERFNFLIANIRYFLFAAVIGISILSLQFIYWKYATGDWFVYSYQDQHFQWLKPRIYRGLLGVNIGWWAYTPIMLVAMFGWLGLYKRHRSIFLPVFLTSVLAIYVTLAWPYFEQGGGLGQRNLIQMYPLMAFPLGIVITGLIKKRAWIWYVLFGLNMYYSLWWVHQAHRGGFFRAGQMTTPYFLNIIGRPKPNPDYAKMMDSRDYYFGVPDNPELIYEYVSADSLQTNLVGTLNQEAQWLGPFELPVDKIKGKWIRIEGDFTVLTHEWDFWKQAQMILTFDHGENRVKTNLIRLQRVIYQDQQTTHVFMDCKIPEDPFTKATITFWNVDSGSAMKIENLKASVFTD